jgi:hypothetical protein
MLVNTATHETNLPWTVLNSFWHICLANLPEGAFCRSRNAPEDAKLRIEQARKANTLLCLSDDDLLAPYRKKECKNHDALCRVLSEHFGIALSLKDFCSSFKNGDHISYTINPLNCVEINNSNPLLVVTCAYNLGEMKDDATLPFEIDPTTVEFHMIEARWPRHAGGQDLAPIRRLRLGCVMFKRFSTRPN